MQHAGGQYPSSDIFKTHLLSKNVSDIASDYLFQGMPYAFLNDESTYEALVTELSAKLEIPSKQIFLVGSAKLGFSMSPHNFPRQFSDSSDLDIAIYDEELFDKIWMALLKWNYPRKRNNMSSEEAEFIRRWRSSIFWGNVDPRLKFDGLYVTEEIRYLNGISLKWFDSIASLSLIPNLSSREINSRLYRNFDFMKEYHLDSLEKLKSAIISQEQAR